jgi:hypothetical protein
MEGPQEEIPETIDTSKIIDYPGFNVMPPRGVYDVRLELINHSMTLLVLLFCF